MIMDPGVKIEAGYEAYEDGLRRGIFIRRPPSEGEDAQEGKEEATVGKVWPGLVSFVDFSHPQAAPYWTGYLAQVHEQQMAFDGVWVDITYMSMPSSFEWKMRVSDLNLYR